MFYRSFGREVASVLFKALVVVFSLVFLFSFVDSWYQEVGVSDGFCNIAVLPIEGVILPFTGYDDFELVTTPSSVRSFVSMAEADPSIIGLLLDINSPGGAPVASEQISEIIQTSTLPSIGLIGDIGTSGGYLVAAATGKIIASAMSDVGSIGVTMSYLENSKQNEEEGITFVELNSGKFKDAGNPNKPLTDEERTLFESDLTIVHDEFVRQVASLRGVEVIDLASLADGSAMPGLRALEVGLVDRLGGRQVVKEEFSAILGLDAEQIVFCEYTPSIVLF